MKKKIIPNNNEFPRFLNQLAKDLSTFYYNKLSKKFKVQNKIKGKGYDPVTSADRAFEKFIRFKINKKFPNHEIIGEEYGFLGIVVLFVCFGIIFHFGIQILKIAPDRFGLFLALGIILNLIFILFWIFLMSMMGSITFYLLKNLHKDFLKDSKIAAFSGFFALGFWGFLSYHAGVFLYSMYNDPSFLYDLVFMIITIMLVIYSLSVNVLRGEARRAHLSPTNHYIGKATGLMSRHNVIFYSISFTIAYGASNFFLATADTSLIGGIKGVSRIAHMIVLVSGILVLLIVNYNLLTGRGLISEGFVESIRSPKHN